jgi:hypothetical protein
MAEDVDEVGTVPMHRSRHQRILQCDGCMHRVLRLDQHIPLVDQDGYPAVGHMAALKLLER